MTIYVVLLGFILTIAMAASFAYPDKKERESFILKVGMIAIYLVLALKKYTVGTDIPGYKQQYSLSAVAPWGDFDYVYFEPGYIFFMKIFSKLNLDFQVFMIVIYTFVCLAMYYFIKKYSKNVTLSLMIFLSYQFFVFYISGVRQTIAMSICLIAYMVLDNREKSKAYRILGCIGLVILATTFHESAYIFLLVIPFEFIKFKKTYLFMYIPLVLAGPLLRPVLLNVIKIFFTGLKTDGTITLQGNFVFLLLFCILSVIAIMQYRPQEVIINTQTSNDRDIDEKFLFITVNMVVLLVALQFFFSGLTIIRSTMYFTLFLIPGLTNVLKCFENKIEIIATWVILIGFIYMFFAETLFKNELNLCPYLAFWQ